MLALGGAGLERLALPEDDAGYLVAALAVSTGIAPAVLLAEPDVMLATMLAVIQRQAEEMENR